MTILATWRHSRDNLAIASDSRLSWMKTHMDNCVKVFPIRMKIKKAVAQETGAQETYFDENLGIAFCGKADISYMIATAASILLSNVQTIPSHFDISMDRISGFVKLLFEKIISTSFAIYFDDSNTEILVTGYCPKQSKLRVFKLFPSEDVSEKGFSLFHKSELLVDNNIAFLGSGKQKAYEIYESKSSKNPLRVIRELIEAPDEPEIGGDLQFGDFTDKSFFAKGFQRPKMKNGRIEYAFAGLDVFDGEFSFENTGLAVQIPCIAPFMNELMQDAFNTKVE